MVERSRSQQGRDKAENKEPREEVKDKQQAKVDQNKDKVTAEHMQRERDRDRTPEREQGVSDNVSTQGGRGEGRSSTATTQDHPQANVGPVTVHRAEDNQPGAERRLDVGKKETAFQAMQRCIQEAEKHAMRLNNSDQLAEVLGCLSKARQAGHMMENQSDRED
jgi:hypothetical protein